MSYFDNVNDKFFNPFCCKNREVYFECISLLIEKSKEILDIYLLWHLPEVTVNMVVEILLRK